MKINKKILTLILISLAVADLLGAIDATGVNIALPTIARDLNISISIIQWIPNAYTLVLVCMLIFMGKIGDMIGAKKLYLYGLLVFGIASLLLGFINNIYALIAIRAIQGLGTAILYTMPMAIIAQLWKEREKAFAVTASFFAAGMLLGPLVGGFLTGLNFGIIHGWHLIFLLNIPFIILGMIVTARFIPVLSTESKKKLDFLSIFLLFTGLTIVVLALTLISSWYLVLGASIILFLYFYERQAKYPLLDFGLFKNRTFTAANLVSFFAMITFVGMSFVLTFYLQDILKWNPLQTGLAFLPMPIATMVFATLGSRIKNWRLGAFLTSGLIFAGILLLTRINPATSYFEIILPSMILIAAGSGILMSTIFAAILGSAPAKKSGTSSGILNTLQQLGSLIGIALVASIALQYRLSLGILVVVSLMGLMAALFVTNNKTFLPRNNQL